MPKSPDYNQKRYRGNHLDIGQMLLFACIAHRKTTIDFDRPNLGRLLGVQRVRESRLKWFIEDIEEWFTSAPRYFSRSYIPPNSYTVQEKSEKGYRFTLTSSFCSSALQGTMDGATACRFIDDLRRRFRDG